ncbi:hypothetical protein DDD_0262 [Nonlabens dokdonensis DSW-6]|uniref:Uncharacterized protein n=1 Tax=Nonlabens dokdonensis (strain DSM 17205 / KCTC 12402 / DSW-6) TaxID=592029 RepID=L7W958_NONDD|nr:hypothetical protein DDD_0262 [Nonlabens dokdonensis DSW-6]
MILYFLFSRFIYSINLSKFNKIYRFEGSSSKYVMIPLSRKRDKNHHNSNYLLYHI